MFGHLRLTSYSSIHKSLDSELAHLLSLITVEARHIPAIPIYPPSEFPRPTQANRLTSPHSLNKREFDPQVLTGSQVRFDRGPPEERLSDEKIEAHSNRLGPRVKAQPPSVPSSGVTMLQWLVTRLEAGTHVGVIRRHTTYAQATC